MRCLLVPSSSSSLVLSCPRFFSSSSSVRVRVPAVAAPVAGCCGGLAAEVARLLLRSSPTQRAIEAKAKKGAERRRFPMPPKREPRFASSPAAAPSSFSSLPAGDGLCCRCGDRGERLPPPARGWSALRAGAAASRRTTVPQSLQPPTRRGRVQPRTRRHRRRRSRRAIHAPHRAAAKESTQRKERAAGAITHRSSPSAPLGIPTCARHAGREG